MSKVYQKQNLKLKSVRTLLKITCFANRKSYVVIISANLCEKLINSENEVDLNIAQNHLFGP